jgi:subtilisin family serine protease
MPLRPRLAVEHLERRDVPANFDPSHVIVEWKDGLVHPTGFGLGAEALGAGEYRVNLPPVATVDSALAYFQGRPGVAFAQPDYEISETATPDDPSFGSQWGLSDIGAPTAWNTSTGTGKIVVAVIDSGMAYNHPDLKANVWHDTTDPASAGITVGYNFVSNNANPADDNGHGTHVSGIIGAVGDNRVGVTGVDWHVQLMPLKFLDSSGSGYTSNAVRAMNFAVNHGAKIVNASFGGGPYDSAMAAAIANARAHGVIVVTAAGNDGTDNDTTPEYPASYSSDNLISVAAIDQTDHLAGFSDYGKSVTIAAPGVGILSTLPNGKYGSYSGTSMAAPFVTGALALVWDDHPTWTYKQVIAAVENTADRLPALTGKVATGKLDLAKAIAYNPSGTTTPTPSPVPSGGTSGATTFASKDVGKAILALGSITSQMTITANTTVHDLNVQVSATGVTDQDVQMTLTAPDGTKVILFNRRGGSGTGLLNTLFDDKATSSIWRGSAPFSGSYKPEYVLSALDGKSLKGTWTLTISNVLPGTAGKLTAWSLTAS